MKRAWNAPPPDGFTLAEVLITIGIIGVVAALTLPTLINNHKRKVLESKFKKGYSTLQNAYLVYSGLNNNNIKDFISAPEWYNKKENTAPFIDSFPNGIKSYGSITPVNGKLNSTASDYYNLSMLRYDGSPIHRQGLYRGSIQLNDGLTFTIYNNGDVKNQFIIILDTNGAGSKPNRIGYDIFFFTIIDNKVIPIAPSGTSLYFTSIVLDPAGAGNTYYAVQNVCPTNPKKNYWECLQL